MRPLVQLPKSKFVKVQCKKCKNEQIIYNKASTVVRCLKCEEILAQPTGGEAIIKGKVLQVLS